MKFHKAKRICTDCGDV